MHETQYHLLKTKRFLPYFAAQSLQALNDSIFRNAFSILITYRLISDAASQQMMIAIIFGLFTLPFFLFSATAGQLADKFEKSRLIRIIKFFEIIIMAIGALGFYTNNTLLLFGTLFLLGVHSTFFGPIKYAILPDHLRKDELIGGNALVEASTFLAILMGGIIGNQLILTHHGVTLMTILLTTLAITGWLCSFFIPRTPVRRPELKLNPNFIGETWSIIKHTRHNRDVFLAILGISWFWLVGTVLLSQIPPFTKNVLGAQASVVNLFMIMFSLGIATGSILCNKLLKSKISAKYVPFAMFVMTFFIGDTYLASRHVSVNHSDILINASEFLTTFMGWRLLADMFLLAVGAGLYIVPLFAIIQTRCQAQYRSRTIAANNIINALFMVSGVTIAVALIAIHFSVTQLFLTLAIANAFAALYICKLLPHATIKSFFKWLLRALYKVEVNGLDHYKAAGDNIILIANHTSFLDVVLLSAFLPDVFTFAINKNVAKKWWLQPFLSLVDTFPIDPANRMATRSMIKSVRSGKKLIIFPEGRITMTGTLMKVYEGSGLIADKSAAKLLPVRIDGAQYTIFSRMHGKVRIRLFPKITLSILPAQSFEIPASIKGRKRRRMMGTHLYTMMTNMVFASSNYHKTLYTEILDARKIHGGRFVIVEDMQRKPINYNQFVMRSIILGRVIAKQSQPGENIGLFLPTTNAAIISFFACHVVGRIPTMLNYSAGYHSLKSACHTAQLKTIYTSRRFIATAKLEDLIEQLSKHNITIVYLEDLRMRISLSSKAIGYVLSKFPMISYRRLAPKASASDPGVVLFTSGSEGMPKGVILSHENMLANCYQMQARVDFNSRDIVLNTLPIFHCFGLTAGCLLPILGGVRTFLYPSPLHYRVIPELTYDINATIMFGTDTFLSGYARHAHAYDFYSIRYIFAGAERLKPETYQCWTEKFGIRIFEGYGATETAPVLATNTPLQNKMSTVGCLLPGLEQRIEPVEGIEQGGRLFVKGPNVMQGYLLADKPGEIQRPEKGWYDTGDIVDIDEEGYLRILGRAKRFAKIAGEMVSLTAVESLIASLWPEQQHAVVSVSDAKKGEKLILVTTRQDAKRTAIVDHIKQQGYNELNIPKTILVIAELPVMASGKTDYSQVFQDVQRKMLAS